MKAGPPIIFPDPIKKHSFQVYNAAMHPIDHELNDLSIILSKNFGLIKTFNFYFFPESEGYLPFYEELQECELIGLSRPKLGIQNITWLDIFDYQPGDEIHILYEYFSADEYYTQANTIKTITKYLSRNDYLDSIIYTRERKRSELRVWDDSSSFIFKHDTLVLVIKPDSIFDKLPGEPVVNDYEAYAYSMNGQTKIQPSVAGRIWPGFDTCWSNCCVDDCSSDYYYYQGLGGPYYQCDFPFTMGGIKNQLVYYKKGDVTWGTPLVVSAIDEPVLHNEIEVYPNPASSELTVTIPVILLPLQFELINLAGTIIFSTEIESGAYSIPLDDKLEGLYIYKLTSSGFASAGKIVIE
jgi:hypothetical protein